MQGTTPDRIMFKPQVLDRAVRSGLLLGAGVWRRRELVRLWWGSKQVRKTDREL